MDEEIRTFGITLGERLLARDWAGASAMFAPWLRAEWSPERLGAFVEEQVQLTLDANEMDDAHWPEHPEPIIDGNAYVNATKLREPKPWGDDGAPPVPDELTDDMVRYWMSVQLVCSDEQMETLPFDSFMEARALIVQLPEGLRVGYWKAGDN